MLYKQTTQVPNIVIDKYLPCLTEAELKVLFVVIRQTLGWVNKRTGGRKTRDRISRSQFQSKTGMSKRIITNSIQSLSSKKLIRVSDFHNNELCHSWQRKGKSYLYYALSEPVQLETQTKAQMVSAPVQKSYHNKTNYKKLSETKRVAEFSGHISGMLDWKDFLMPKFRNK